MPVAAVANSQSLWAHMKSEKVSDVRRSERCTHPDILLHVSTLQPSQSNDLMLHASQVFVLNKAIRRLTIQEDSVQAKMVDSLPVGLEGHSVVACDGGAWIWGGKTEVGVIDGADRMSQSMYRCTGVLTLHWCLHLFFWKALVCVPKQGKDEFILDLHAQHVISPLLRLAKTTGTGAMTWFGILQSLHSLCYSVCNKFQGRMADLSKPKPWNLVSDSLVCPSQG